MRENASSVKIYERCLYFPLILDSFSCPLLCLNEEQKCELDVGGKNVALEPGMVLEEVEAVFRNVPFCGGICLLADKCARISKVITREVGDGTLSGTPYANPVSMNFH